MSYQQKIHYEVDTGLRLGVVRMRMVEGEPIHLDGIPGTFALRRQRGGYWLVDHVESGCRVFDPAVPTRDQALNRVHYLAKQHGARGFQKAIDAAKSRMASRKAGT